MNFGITPIVNAVGEMVVISGVTKTYNTYGDATETYTTVSGVTGVVDVMDGSEELVAEGILSKNDIIFFADETVSGAVSLATDNYLIISGATSQVSAIFRITNSLHNKGHYEVWAKRVMDI
jgi:hypothetical protein